MNKDRKLMLLLFSFNAGILWANAFSGLFDSGIFRYTCIVGASILTMICMDVIVNHHREC